MTELKDVEVRVLGALIEKDMTTPDYYPLSLNAVTNACNQKTNREPVTSYDEATVSAALEGLRAKGLASVLSGREVRVPKHAHRAAETLNLGNRELAVLCVLLLRGPQTLGEIRERAGRIYAFDDLEAVEACLRRLMEREPEPLVTLLARATGRREPRYAHLLAGEVSELPPETAAPVVPDRLAALEAEVASLREEVREIKQAFAEFRKQFE